jgi:hypothetical protein
MSAMLLENNGKESSSNQTKHINVIYFFIEDQVGAVEITIKHCPTNDMVADHFTKPVQGIQFRKLRSNIQGISEGMDDALMGWDRPSLKTKRVPNRIAQAHRSVLAQIKIVPTVPIRHLVVK